MILVDSSAWIELLRATEQPAHRTLRRLLSILHIDRDFDVIARHTPLEIVALDV